MGASPRNGLIGGSTTIWLTTWRRTPAGSVESTAGARPRRPARPRRALAGAGLLATCLGAALAGEARAGEARCWIDRGAVVVSASYGPVAGDFILDLSQPASQLHDTAARTAGATDDRARWTLRLAGEARRDFPMQIADLDGRISAFPTNIAGVLGADALGPFTLDLDLAPCRLRLTIAPSRRGRRPSRIRWIGGAPAVFAGVSDGVTARTGWFAIDTASAGSRLAAAGFSRPLPKGVDPGDRISPPAAARAVSVGGRLAEQTPAGVMTAAAPGLAGALGTSIWSRGHLRIGARALTARP
jgi:hypothetical protein